MVDDLRNKLVDNAGEYFGDIFGRLEITLNPVVVDINRRDECMGGRII